MSPVSARLKVAVLLSGREKFSPYFGGAVARWTYEVYSLLRDRLSATVFGFPTPEKALYPFPHETSGISAVCSTISRVPLLRRYEEALWLRTLAGRLRAFDVVHIHNRPQWVWMLRAAGYKRAIVLHLHNDHLGHWPADALDALALEVGAVAACSQYLAGTFTSKSTPLKANTQVVYNGANLQLFFPKDEVREPDTIFFVGRFDPEKGVLQLLRAYEKVLTSHPRTRLVIGGGSNFGSNQETHYVREVNALAQSLIKQRNAKIQFTGYLDHDTELTGWFQRATIFSCPSLFQEPFGMVNAEAMACATPVIASRRGGIPEVIGDAGILVEPEDSSGFAEAISELLSNPKEREALGRAGYERCRKMFDWHCTAATWSALVHKIA
ncbi:MAG TPA: glycosyltransferase family 4 protein [Candidatus Binatia bacterium]|nr:glycosyltransferase family 4 protein [Candidatus Binatia bacterium]